MLNERGEVAGLANTPLSDPFTAFCFDLGGDCFVTHAFEAHGGATLTDLGALPRGASSAATWISENGLIAGLSQTGEIDPSVPQFPEDHAVLWQRGEIIDLGTLEGGSESYAAAVNSRGQVVGAAINTVPDANSMGSFWLGPPFPFETRAFLWEKGLLVDLNALISSRSSLQLADAEDINDRGEIAGIGVPPGVPVANYITEGHGFLLVPCDENHPGVEGCDYSLVEASATADHKPTPMQRPTTAKPWVSGTDNPMMRFFGHRTMPWYRNLGVQPPPK